jgi:hypothetical protein
MFIKEQFYLVEHNQLVEKIKIGEGKFNRKTGAYYCMMKLILG